MKRVLITGASGFVGSALCGVLAESGYLVRATGRTAHVKPKGASEQVVVGNLGGDLQWHDALEDVDAVVHLAARAHVLGDSPTNAKLYREANALGTLSLARQAAAVGVRQFVLLSSIKVNGEATTSRPFTACDEPHPRDAYGVSKWEAEQFVTGIGGRTGMSVAIVRSPLVYGPGVKANFLKLMHWIDQERVLPLGAVKNRRSLVSVWNLCDVILRLLAVPTAPTRTWMVSDDEDVSTPELVVRLAAAMGRRARLLWLPVGPMQILGRALGYGSQMTRLCGSLVVDIADTRAGLAWSPPVSLREGIERTVRWYLSEVASHGC